MEIKYKGRTYGIVSVQQTSDGYYFTVELDNTEDYVLFANTLDKITPENKSEFKDNYEGIQGIVPFDIFPERDVLRRVLGRFKADTWAPDKNAEQFERVKRIKEKLYKKCMTCENFGPNFGICFKQQLGPGWSAKGICDKYEVIDDGYVSELSDEELESDGYFEF